MKNMLGQNLKTFFIRIVVFTFLMGTLYIVVENYLIESHPTDERVLPVRCDWIFTTKAWVDANSNQILDENEKPLASVQIYVDEIGPTPTNERGIAVIKGSGFCGNTNPNELSANSPDGYKPTTPVRMKIESYQPEEPFRFGFIEE